MICMKDKSKFKEISTIFAVVLVGCFIGLKIWQSFFWPKINLSLKGEQLTVFVANNEEHRYRGLGGRKSLGKYHGMMFAYGYKGRFGVVMRDMLFSIDVVWFNDGEVVDIAPNLPLEPGVSEENLRIYRPRLEANAFLELPAGWVDLHDLKIGDKLSFIE